MVGGDDRDRSVNLSTVIFDWIEAHSALAIGDTDRLGSGQSTQLRLGVALQMPRMVSFYGAVALACPILRRG